MANRRTTKQAISAYDNDEFTDSSDIESAAQRSNKSVATKDMKRRGLVHIYNKEEKRTVMIAPMYRAYFGNIMHVSINGISCAVPCNGKPYVLPKTFADSVQRKLRAINEQQAKQKKFADVASNYERAPGELALY